MKIHRWLLFKCIAGIKIGREDERFNQIRGKHFKCNI